MTQNSVQISHFNVGSGVLLKKVLSIKKKKKKAAAANKALWEIHIQVAFSLIMNQSTSKQVPFKVSSTS